MNKFNVVVPVYNAEQWIGKCLDSIVSQDYPYFDIIVIDDDSTDNTYDIIKSYNVYSIKNKARKGALANIVKGIECIGKDIVVTIDGDDYLADKTVFSHLNEVYNENVWMTYGSFAPVSGRYSGTCQPFENCRYVKKDGTYDFVTLSPNNYRKSGHWVTSHLRTFRKRLWDRINKNDLLDIDGNYYKMAWDMAFMYPMIEMSGNKVLFIEKILYIYNDLNPICDGTLNPSEQTGIGERIQAKKEYARLNGNIL